MTTKQGQKLMGLETKMAPKLTKIPCKFKVRGKNAFITAVTIKDKHEN